MTDSAFGGNPDAEAMTDAGIPIERLLAHRAWVRAVARALAHGDGADADDLEQEAWIAALDGPPRHDGSLRGWLGGVLRRRSAMQHRGRARRDRRELAAARAECGARPADELVAEAESHARLAQAVVALPEPERTAILLRFFEGLPPREVASRTGVPVETARSRIRRALGLLREELGGRDGSDDRLALVVAPLVATRHAAPALTRTAATAAAAGGLAMGLATQVGVAALVLVGAGTAWWTLREAPPANVADAASSVATGTATVAATPAPHPRVRALPPAAPDADASPGSTTSKTTTRAVRWKVLPGDVPDPPTGSVLPVEPDRGAIALPWGLKSVRVDGDDLVAEEIGGGTIHGFAVAPDGSRARLFALNGDERGSDTSFLRERRIVVTLRDADGNAAVGVPLELHDQGNNAIRSGVVTDTTGRAEFAGLSPTQGRVEVFDGMLPVGRWLGTLDVRQGDVHVTWTLPAARDVTVRITVDGERRIPPGLRISSSAADVTDRHDDESSGSVRVRVRPPRDGAECALGVSADGRAPTSFRIPAGRGPATVDVAIPRGVTFVGRVLAPAGTPVRVNSVRPPRSGLNVQFERRSETGARWAVIHPGGVLSIEGTEPGDGGVVRFASLRLGTYRLREETTGATSAEVDLSEDGSESPIAALDLTRAGPLRGHVDAGGAAMGDVRVIVEGLADPLSGDTNRRSVRPAGDGTFETWVPGDRPLHLRVEHPVLRPDTEQGAADVTGPTDGIVLRLVEGPTISFRVPGVVLREEFHRMNVRFFRGEPSSAPAFEKSVNSDDDRYCVGGIDPGTWTLWIDVPDRAPKVVRDVVLGDRSIDLGDVVPEPGLSLRVRIATFPDEATPRIGVSVSRKDGVRFFRTATSNGESDVVVKGLVPGAYEVAVYPQTGSFRSDFMEANEPPYLHRTVVVGGSGETTIDYSPR